MHLPILLATLLSQGALDQAQFHPADVDLYLEVGDPQALLEAMRASSLLDTFRDEPVRDFVGAVSGLGPYDLDGMIDGFWGSQVPDPVRGLLEGIEACSFSVRVGQGSPDYLGVVRFASAEQVTAALDLLQSDPGVTPLADSAWPLGLRLEGPPDLDPWVAPHGRFLITGSRSMRDAGLEGRLGQTESGFASNGPFARSTQALGEFGAQALIEGFASRSPITILAEAALYMPQAPIDQLQLVADWNLLDGPHYFRMGAKNQRYVTEFFSPSAQSTAQEDSILGVEPIDATRAAAIPTGILGAYATTIDAARIGQVAQSGLEQLSGMMGRPGLLSSLEEDLGFPITRLFDHLGSQVTLQMQAIKGPSIPETALWIDLQDAEAFAADLALVAEKLPIHFQGIETRTRTYKVKNAAGERVPFPITSLSLPPDLIEAPVPITLQPSLTIANGRLLIGFSSTHVKRELKRLFGPEPPAEDAANPWKQSGFELPQGARSATFIDWGNQIAGLVSLAKALGPMLGGDVPFDFNSLPEGETFVRHFRPTVDFRIEREDGTYRYHEGSFGPELWLVPFLAQYAMSASNPSRAGGMAAQPVPDDNDFATEIALQQMRSAIQVFSIDRGALPNSLGDLLGSSSSFPSGYLPGGALPKDGWGRDLIYHLTSQDESGGSFQLYSRGPNGLDEGGAGDDISVQ